MSNRTYERIAPLYNLLDAPHEFTWRRQLRGALFRDLRGRVLDAGVGTGRNVCFYPDDCEVIAVDRSPGMLRVARREADWRRKSARFFEMDILGTAFADGSFDAIVATFLFGILREDQQYAALKELARICKPGGTIRLLDYALSRKPLPRLIMELAKPWSLHVFSQRFDAGTEPYVDAAGLEVRESRYAFADIAKVLVLQHRARSADLAPRAVSPERVAGHAG